MTIEGLASLLAETEQWFVSQGQNYAAFDSANRIEAVHVAARGVLDSLTTYGDVSQADILELLKRAVAGSIPNDSWNSLRELVEMALRKKAAAQVRLEGPPPLPEKVATRANLIFRGKVRETDERIKRERQEKRRLRAKGSPGAIANPWYEKAEDGEARAEALLAAYLDSVVDALAFYKEPVGPYQEAISRHLRASAASATGSVTGALRRGAAATGALPGVSAVASRSTRNIAGSLAEVERRLRLLAEDEPIAPAARSWRDLEPTEASEFPGLAMKRTFDADVITAIAESSLEQPLSMVFVDVDDLKSLNTRFTNPKVNKGLSRLAEVLASVSRGRGKAYRYGGDEFVLLLPNSSADEAAATAERVRRAVEALSIPDVPEMSLTISSGVACVEDVSPRSPETLEEEAAKAARTAKEDGKNRVVVYGRH